MSETPEITAEHRDSLLEFLGEEIRDPGVFMLFLEWAVFSSRWCPECEGESMGEQPHERCDLCSDLRNERRNPPDGRYWPARDYVSKKKEGAR